MTSPHKAVVQGRSLREQLPLFYSWAARIPNGILNSTFTFDISQFSQNASSYVAEKGKDLSAAIDGETRGDVRRLLLGLLLVS